MISAPVLVPEVEVKFMAGDVVLFVFILTQVAAFLLVNYTPHPPLSQTYPPTLKLSHKSPETAVYNPPPPPLPLDQGTGLIKQFFF